MKENSFVSTDHIRSAFSAAMSAMYRTEVPAYGTLMELVGEVNAENAGWRSGSAGPVFRIRIRWSVSRRNATGRSGSARLQSFR